ncbi:MAG: nucleotidyltransferase domain-containing protein [Nitrospirota bacterium]
MVKREIAEKIKKFVKELKKENIDVAKVILYGSMVSDYVHEYSDIDIAIVSPDFGKDRYEEGQNYLKLHAR